MDTSRFVLTVEMEGETPESTPLSDSAATVLAKLGLRETTSGQPASEDDTLVSIGYLTVTSDPEDTEPIDMNGTFITPAEMCELIACGANVAVKQALQNLADDVQEQSPTL